MIRTGVCAHELFSRIRVKFGRADVHRHRLKRHRIPETIQIYPVLPVVVSFADCNETSGVRIHPSGIVSCHGIFRAVALMFTFNEENGTFDYVPRDTSEGLKGEYDIEVKYGVSGVANTGSFAPAATVYLYCISPS